ncbi:cytochrome P450 [Yinghuangia sp. YIM S09857]|uniref:cytochrome P450 n=1 Tax=Yinghuangia sp. YIM S09857 TaxID=3436929 RepID=UPI003F52EE3E
MATDLSSVPRAPGRIPVLGHAVPLLRRPLPFLRSLRDTGDVVRVELGTMPVYFVTTPELVHQLLVTKGRDFDKGRLLDRARKIAGEGLVTAGEEVHRRHRRLMQPMFHHGRVAAYVDSMAEQARLVADSWEPGRTIALNEELYDFAINTVTATLFAADLDAEDAGALRHDVPILIKGVLVRAVLPEFLDRAPIPFYREFDASTARLHRIIADLIAAGRKAGDQGGTDLLSTLLLARDADTGEGLTDDEIRDELSTVMFAGTESSASTLAWIFHELAVNPEAEKRVLDEIDAVLGGGPVGLAEVGKLEYVGRVVDEASRLHAIPMLMRRATADVELGGVRIPRGTEIAFSLYAMHRDARVHTDPERFDPDRWLPEQREGRPRTDFMVFGAGTRKCIGDAFARMEMTVAVATILARWRLRPAPGVPVKEVAAAVAHPDRLPMIPEPRAA